MSFLAQRWPWFLTGWCSHHLSHPWRSFSSTELQGHGLPAWLQAAQWEDTRCCRRNRASSSLSSKSGTFITPSSHRHCWTTWRWDQPDTKPWGLCNLKGQRPQTRPWEDTVRCQEKQLTRWGLWQPLSAQSSDGRPLSRQVKHQYRVEPEEDAKSESTPDSQEAAQGRLAVVDTDPCRSWRLWVWFSSVSWTEMSSWQERSKKAIMAWGGQVLKGNWSMFVG